MVVLAVRRTMLVLVAAAGSVLFATLIAAPAAARTADRPADARLHAPAAAAASAAPPSTSPPGDNRPRTVETTPREQTVVPGPKTTAPRGNRLIPVPAGCPRPDGPEVVFVGTVIDSDSTTARFRLQQVRSGSADRYARRGLIDVEYGIDTKYLRQGGQYLVGAGVDRDAGVLTSKVRSEQPLFGGDDVVGVAESDADCPVFEDPIRTLTVTGRSIESGVLEPLKSARGDILRAVTIPVIVAFGILLALATLRWILTGVAHGASSAISHTRQHGRADDVPPG